jgi:methionyl-tRNA formyltransferase
VKKKILLFTTKTSHHIYFINQISKISNLAIIFEERKLKHKFKTSHYYENQQNLYEKKNWFKNKKLEIKKKLNFINVKNINNLKTVKFVNTFKPDIIFSFGISKLTKACINKISKTIYNFHGGDSMYYRGLDSQLWSLYHNDRRGLKVTLHEVDSKLDTGRVVYKKELDLKKTSNLFQLRSINTEICLKLATKLINDKKIKKTKLTKFGRYYSTMPSVIKNLIYKNYKKKIKFIYK